MRRISFTTGSPTKLSGETDDNDEDELEVADATCRAGTDEYEQTPRLTSEDTWADEAVERPFSHRHRRRRSHLRDNWNKNDRRDSWIGRDVMSRC